MWPAIRERAKRFELSTFSLARRRSTTELRPHQLTCCATLDCPAPDVTPAGSCGAGKWTRSDSNRRSSPCKGDAFPLGHGPLCADERTRTSTPVRAIDPKSIASAIPPRRPSAPPSCGLYALAKYSEKGAFTQIRGGLVPPILSGRSLVATA